MKKKLCIVLLLLILFVGCSKTPNINTISPPHLSPNMNPILTDTIPSATEGNTMEDIDTTELQNFVIPQLSDSFDSIVSFIPENWLLLDSVEFDYNSDGLMDVVGVLDPIINNTSNYLYEQDEENPYSRILFAAKKTSDGHYLLDFQDINLIRSRYEGGIFGDPYEPLTSKDNTFTINAYGGSAWRWSEATTFEYRNNDWYLAQTSTTDGYGFIETYAAFDDYTTGIGIRKLNNDNSDNIDWLFENAEEDQFELEYTVKLDPAPTLYEASQRWWLAPDRLTEISIKDVQVAAHINLNPSDVPNPTLKVFDIKYMDESYFLYDFKIKDVIYLAIYNRKSQNINVIFQSTYDSDSSSPYYSDFKIYNDKLYFGETIYAPIKVKKDNEIVETQGRIYSQIICINLDGTEKQVLFRYDNKYTENEILEDYLPYISTGVYPSGGELIISLYIGDEIPKKYYRMNLNGTNIQYIGETKGFYR